ncbi:hypothetical protein [Pedobacter boryungensis]|uniref:Uncharacterized protein n=1 Tax=Pedobacter boryungensis TaxID=869962 RepID=A0ABX2DDE5_9SPHI|nr:hypothetical protein [Pedobacter boryungensis]NQX31837.1 hypothetical protein [Pedobacter boryungensis]
MSIQKQNDMSDIEWAQQMVSAFKKAERGKSGYTRSVWFPIQQMKNLMDTIANEPHADGVRVYFGRYTKAVIDNVNSNLPQGEPKIPGTYVDRNTVIFVSTKNENGRPMQDYMENALFSEPKNRGALCPPDTGCDCTSDIIDPNDPDNNCP